MWRVGRIVGTDWEGVEEDAKEEFADDNPKNDPDRRETGKKPLVNY